VQTIGSGRKLNGMRAAFVCRVPAPIVSYRDLVAWQRAMDLAEAVYRLTRTFPPEERFVLSAQMRRSAISVPSNVAEGQRVQRSRYANHLLIALGSHAELETQALLAHRLGFISDPQMREFDRLATEVGKITRGLLKSIERARD
jgi:four helix bundle protein